MKRKEGGKKCENKEKKEILCNNLQIKKLHNKKITGTHVYTINEIKKRVYRLTNI